jgi:tetratricopeptide (TPR) repeat protein
VQTRAVRLLPLVIWCGYLVGGGLPGLLPTRAQAAEHAELSYAKGIIAYGNRNYLEALDHFRRAVEVAPENPDAQFYLGLTLTRIGEFQEAIVALEKTLKLAPAKRYVHYHLGLAYFQAAQYQAALHHFEQAVQFDPNKATAHFYLGYTHYQLRHYRQALPALQRALVLDPTLALTAQYYRGLAFYALERDAQAHEALQAAIAAAPDSLVARNAQRYLDALARRARERRLVQLQGAVSFQYDDNVTIANDDIISREADGRTVLAFVGRLLPVRTAPWRLGVEYSLFQSLHFDLHEFDIQNHTGKLFARLTLPRVTLGVAADYTYTTLDDDRFSEAITVQPSATIRQAETLFVVTSVRYRRSNYFNQFIPIGQAEVRDRDGWSVQVGANQYVTFHQQRSYLRLSYHFEASRNSGSDWEYDSHRLGLGLHFPLLWGITVDVEGAYRRRDYLHVNSFDAGQLAVLEPGIDRRRRQDDRFTASVALTRKVGRYLFVSASFAHTSNIANIGFFDYRRNIWTVALTGRY